MREAVARFIPDGMCVCLRMSFAADSTALTASSMVLR
jgi:hypothetical protein